MDHLEIIEKLVKFARPEILKEFRSDSCIVSTAIGIDVLTHFGILAEPLAVQTILFNKPFINRINAGQDWPVGEELSRWTKEDGSYSVGIGFGGKRPGCWAGHLVILADKKHLIDLSIDQATRPNFNMAFEPFCVSVEEEFLTGTRIEVFETDGCVMRIEVLKNTGYLSSPDWIFKDRRQKIVETIIKFIEEYYG